MYMYICMQVLTLIGSMLIHNYRLLYVLCGMNFLLSLISRIAIMFMNLDFRLNHWETFFVNLVRAVILKFLILYNSKARRCNVLLISGLGRVASGLFATQSETKL